MKKVKIKKIARSKPMVAIEIDGRIRWVKVKPDIFKELVNIGIDNEVSVEIREEGKELPVILNFSREDSKENSFGGIKIEEISVNEHPPLKKEKDTSTQDSNFLKEITSRTIQALIGKVDIDNIEEVIMKIYSTYKNLN